MGATQLTTRQIGANGINRDDIDTSTSGKSVAVKIIAGSNITISGTGTDTGTGDVTINSSGGAGITYTEVTGTTQALVSGNAYIMNNAGLVTGTLPTTSAVGDIIYIRGKGAGGWKVAQNASQIIHFLDVDSLTGTSGYISSNTRRDCVDLVCLVANLEWEVNDANGNISINA